MDPVVNFINNQSSPNLIEVRNFCARNKIRLSLFATPHSIYQHLRKYGKYRHYSFRDFVVNNIIDLTEKDQYGMSLIENIIVNDEVEFFKVLLLKNFLLNARLCKASTRNIARLLNYKPGRHAQSLAIYCLSCNQRGYYDQQRLEDYFYDAANTTSGDSSDGEDVAGVDDPWKEKDYKRNEKKIKDFIAKHGADLEQYLQDNLEELVPVFVTYRGVHFVPKHYSGDRRKKLRRTKATTNRSTVSYATLKEMGYDADDELLDPNEVTAASMKTNQFFKALKVADDKNEKSNSSRNKFQFPKLFYRFVQAYVMSYDYLFNGRNPAITGFYGAVRRENPGISTTYIAEKAMHYMSGKRFPDEKGLKLNPHYRRTTKKPKHPYLGYTDVYTFDPFYFWKNASYILDLNRRGLINISHMYQFEAEVLFESSIPGKYHFYRDIFRMPDFSKAWSTAVENEFGYTKKMWTQHRNELIKLTSTTSANWLDRVMEKVIEHRAKMLEKTVKYLLKQEYEGSFPVMPYVEAQVAHTPDSISPIDKFKWKKQSVDTPPTPFYRRMENLSLQDDAVKKELDFDNDHCYPTFNLTQGWQDKKPNQLPDHVIATGVEHGQIIIVNNIQYVVQRTKGMGKEPTSNNPYGNIFIAIPRLRGG